MHNHQSYGQEEPVYDNNAYAIKSIYHGGQSKMYTSHPAQLTGLGGLVKHTMYLRRTPIARRELVFRLAKIPKDIITVYTSFRFLLDKTVDPPITETYINPVIIHQKSRLATPQRIPKTIIFFNTKNLAIGAYKKTLEYLI